MAEHTLPYEIKRLILNHVSLATLKSIRLISHAWAAAGAELLFLPEFTVKSTAIDIGRLLKVSSRPNVARQAAVAIQTMTFHSNDWDPVYLRHILCSRHVHMGNYEVLDFVPTQDEDLALTELDILISQRKLDAAHGEDRDILAEAFKAVPNLHTIQITHPNPFVHPLLRKVWEEYSLETYRTPQIHLGPQRLLSIIGAAKCANLCIRNFAHTQFNCNFFLCCRGPYMPWDFSIHLPNLRSLKLVINDVLFSLAAMAFASNENNSTALQRMISSVENLEELDIRFESLDRIPFSFLPSTTSGNLHTLALSGTTLSAPHFLSFIAPHVSTLKRLSLSSVELLGEGGGWKVFLEDVRDLVGERLEKFQLAGLVKSAEVPGEVPGEVWLLWPVYGAGWREMGGEKGARAREVEGFVTKRGEWPIGPADNMSHMFV